METLADHLQSVQNHIPSSVQLVAVTKTRPVEKLEEAYSLGLRDFGENRVQELIEKQPQLPADVRWHLIGHLQTNKVKYIASFVHLIHSVDSLKLLIEINRQAIRNKRVIHCLLQVYIAKEESKFGMDENEIIELLNSDEFASLKNIAIRGLMGMATFTENEMVVRAEFASLKSFFENLKTSYFADNNMFNLISMGMTSDYPIAIEEGSNMVRIGTALFGER
ncbi:MAG: YggS family pyridoxal phosphate-dependent enzyme [Lentimicrobium sp.]|jgi:pyridoxal phosphate enzyme (YggS family)|nr:YggS family pyridoxal phosphate-dependent enzyme [Lentimicrobium sp.]